MTKAQSYAVAELHCNSIKTGLTAYLGRNFCSKLYYAMANTPYSFVLVYEDEQHRPLGFICCATNTSKMYKSVILHHFLSLALSATGKFLRLAVLKKALRTIRRPITFKTANFSQWHLPEAEVVSIGVSPDSQGKQIGTQLVQTAFEKFRSLGYNKVRVWTTEDNKQATVFYQKQGFKLLGTRQHHSGAIHVFVADIDTQG